MTPADRAALANRARSEAACPNPQVVPKDVGKIWAALADLVADNSELVARLETLESRRVGRPPKQRG